MSQNLPAHFVAAAESYLGGQRDIEVRRLSFNDLDRLAYGDAPLDFDAFRLDDQGSLVPVLVSVDLHHSGKPRVNTTFAFDETTGRLDRTKPVGARFHISIHQPDAPLDKRAGTLFTTKAAEQAAEFGSGKAAGKMTRKWLWLPVDSEVFNDDSTGKVKTLPVAAFHGSKVTASFVVEGIAPSALEAKIHLFLAEEFGAAQGSVASIEAQPVRNQRVDVFDAITGKPVAFGILAAEVDLLPGGESVGYTVEPSLEPDDTVILGR